MKNVIFIAVFFACLFGLCSSAFAGKDNYAPKGWLVLRDGVANAKPNYNKEDRDINDRLERVSVLCADYSDTPGNIAALIATDTTHVWGANHGVSKVSTIVGQGGNVVTDPQDGNPNHCLVNGLTLPKIRGVWH